MRVLVHADDVGLSPAVNAAVAEACREGWVTAVSVLATAPTHADGVRALPVGTDVGVHLDLTGFAPLTGADALDEVRGLAQAADPGVLAALDRVATRAPGVVEAEWAAQVETVRALAAVSHVDSHQHVHWRPALWPVLTQLMRRLDIRAVRGIAPWRPEASLPRRALQRARAAHFRSVFAPFVLTDGPCNPATFRWLLERGGPQPALVELVLHPGNDTSPSYAEESRWFARAWPQLRASTPGVGWAQLVAERGEATSHHR